MLQSLPFNEHSCLLLRLSAVWASRRGRIKNIAKYVKTVYPILPFEKKYMKKKYKSVFEGNPLIDIVPEPKHEKITGNKIKIGLFAGSRKSVIKRHVPIIIDAVKILRIKLMRNLLYYA
jgi:lipid-A-disaccharide synthase